MDSFVEEKKKNIRVEKKKEKKKPKLNAAPWGVVDQ